MAAIEVEKLTKRFNGFTAVDALSFEVEEGEIFGRLPGEVPTIACAFFHVSS